QDEFGVAPVEYAQTQRLLLAKRLLTDTRLPVIDVAMSAGFASLRRFNDLFRKRYRMTPGDLRRAAKSDVADRFAFDLAYRPPYDWDAMLAFLAKRAITGVEAIEGRSYVRSIRVERQGKTYTGFISVTPSKRRHALHVVVSASLAAALPVVLARVKHLFDVGAHPNEI